MQIKMSDYIKGILESLPPSMDCESSTPEENQLFTINKDAEILEPAKDEMFHDYVAKCLFLCNHERHNIQTAVAFLRTQVKAPDQDGSKKLRRLMRYFRATQELTL